MLGVSVDYVVSYCIWDTTDFAAHLYDWKAAIINCAHFYVLQGILPIPVIHYQFSLDHGNSAVYLSLNAHTPFYR